MPSHKKLPFEHNSIKSVLFYTAIACAVNVVVFFIINSLNFVHFEMNDDFYIENLLNGSMGEYYTYFMHTNVALSSLLAGLYRIAGAVNWYGVFLFGALLASASLIGGILMDKFRFKLGFSLYLLTIPLVFGLILTRFTYTLVCYAMLACALVCLVYAFYSANAKTQKMLYVLSVVFLVGCVLLRAEVIATVLVYCVALVALMLVKYRKKAFVFCLAVLTAFAAIGCFWLADDLYYKSSDELSDYKEFHEARINLVDHAPLNYALYPGVFADIGWTESDVGLFSGLTYPDDEKYATANLEYIYDQTEATRYNKDAASALSSLVSIVRPEYYVNSVYILICLFLLFVIAFLSQKCPLFRAFTVLIAALPFLFQALFNVLWRTNFRAVYPHYMLSILLLFVFIDFTNLQSRFEATKEGMKRMVTAAALCVVVLFGVGFWALLLDEKWNGDVRAADPNTAGRVIAFETMAVNPDSAYLYPVSSPLKEANDSYSIFHAFPKDYFKNSHLLGGWDTRSPSYNDFKERYGLESLPGGIVDKKGVYLVTPDATALQTYFINALGKETELIPAIDLGAGMEAVEVVAKSNQ